MKAQTLGRVVLGGFMVTAGVLHLTTQRDERPAERDLHDPGSDWATTVRLVPSAKVAR